MGEEGAEGAPETEDQLAAEEELTDEELDQAEQEEPDEDEGQHEDEAPEEDEIPEEEEDELTQVISSETQEWEGLEAAEQQGEAEKTMVRSAAASAAAAGAKARDTITSGFEAVGGKKVTSGFKAVAGKGPLPDVGQVSHRVVRDRGLGRDGDRGKPADVHRWDRRRNPA